MINILKLSIVLAIVISLDACATSAESNDLLARLRRSKPADSHGHHHMMHTHLSRKVFDRVCAASKDTIDEIINCISNNPALKKAVRDDKAKSCYVEAFGDKFDPNDVGKHHELICKQRDKFEEMTACVYSKTAEALDKQEMEKMTEAMVDVGLCIINALD